MVTFVDQLDDAGIEGIDFPPVDFLPVEFLSVDSRRACCLPFGFSGAHRTGTDGFRR